MEPIELINQALSTGLNNAKIYGESHAVERKEGLAYVNAKMEPCAINDGFETVLFWSKVSATPVNSGFGRSKVSRSENKYVLACNSKRDIHDKVLQLINPLCTYGGSSFESLDVASTFYGLSNGNRETYFFSMEFTIVENIKPDTCLDC